MNKVIRLFLVLFFSTSVLAQTPMLKNDPKRPVGKISKDLGVSQEQFVACFNNVKPAPQGEKPTKEHERMNKAVLLPCLQKANNNITNELLDKVMGKYRP
ncbi:MAG: hypothetical protein HRT95_18070 [Moritella sp.]|uniref:hypothetical protein n=1 Tax=Moritella sp. TaxID=78556 RepID=UPI001DE4FE72|nr:hypothetical protein [Moritella sp.]NQZ52003.1 hypothetical protein [Moritella sp.]